MVTLSVVKGICLLCSIAWTKLNCDSKNNCMIQSNKAVCKFKNFSRQKFGKSATKIFYFSSVEGILNVILEQGMFEWTLEIRIFLFILLLARLLFFFYSQKVQKPKTKIFDWISRSWNNL